MGPQSGSCGYLGVHPDTAAEAGELQWVHSLVAVVMELLGYWANIPRLASMGPQSGSCGYLRRPPGPRRLRRPLQWVHSLVAVVMTSPCNQYSAGLRLQWVHSLVAVVIAPLQPSPPKGPRFNGSTVW